MKPILLGMSVWGERHVDTFMKYCWPSLAAPGNLDALRKRREVALVVHTNTETLPLLKNLPFPVLDVTNEDKYLQLGRHQHRDLALAKEAGADYHLLMPDFVYSENCFTGILNAVDRGHKAIARLVVSTTQETIAPELNRPRSAVDLATLSLIHMHPGIKHWMATKDGFPNTHVVAWESKNVLRMCSPHVSPVYIAHEAIKLGGSNLPLDCMLDEVIEGDVYLPIPDDGIVMIELSPKDSRKPDDSRVDLIEFTRILLVDTHGSNKQLQIFDQETIDSINRTMLGKAYWNDLEISEQKSIIRKAITGE